MLENAICSPREIGEGSSKSATNAMEIILTQEVNAEVARLKSSSFVSKILEAAQIGEWQEIFYKLLYRT